MRQVKDNQVKRMIRHGPFYGFTLIELLVVISIISLLISILMPALSKARHEGMKGKCLANLREIVSGTMMYLNDQGDREVIAWYQREPHKKSATEFYDVGVRTPWVFGGFKAPRPEAIEEGPSPDSSVYPAEIRPLNKYLAPAARGGDKIPLYVCPGDRSFRTSVIGTPAAGEFEEYLTSWEANGNSYSLNTRFMQGYAGGSGDFSLENLDRYAERIARHMIGGEASRFVMWMEQGFYSATYRAAPEVSIGAGPRRPGWHRRFSRWSMGFADGHAMHEYYDTRLSSQPAGTIWQPNFRPQGASTE